MVMADFILTSDWHLRESTPRCRTDDFWEAQWKKVQFVSALQAEHECPVLHSGDLFHHWKPSPHLLTTAIEKLPNDFFTIYGQHDLPQHNWELRYKSGIHTLERAGRITVIESHEYVELPAGGPTIGIEGCSWKQEPYLPDCSILLWHKMVWQGKRLWPGQTDPSAVAILKKYKDYDLILTGDNHKPFVEEYQGRLLVNPGSLMRQSASQVDHLPRVYLYYGDTNTVEPVYIPIESDVVSRAHLERSEERDNRISAFIEKIKGDWDTELDFEANLEKFFKTHDISDPVKEICNKALDHE
jgi:DNA repair exonuclease SbcCD nuclease subunit